MKDAKDTTLTELKNCYEMKILLKSSEMLSGTCMQIFYETRVGFASQCVTRVLVMI